MSEEPRRRSTMHHISAVLEQRMQAFPAEYRGVPMRSQLEADFAHYLDSIQAPWEYEPRPFFDADGSGYLPDFRIGTRYFEVKPTQAEVPLAQKRMEAIWREEPDATLIVACAEHCEFFYANRGTPWQSWVERWKH